jgi:uncharacterized protein (TIGR03435 family)
MLAYAAARLPIRRLISCVGGLAILAGAGLTDLHIAHSQTDLSALSFEVASLKPVQPVPPYPVIAGSTVRGTTRLTNVTLADCLRFAFNITSDDQIAGPDWIKSTDTLFEIVAKAPSDTSPDKVRLMVLHLLTERFGLKLRHEERHIPYFALVVEKKGVKFHEANADPDGSANELRRGRIVLHHAPIATLILALGRLGTGRPIVDMTELKRYYDFKLEWAPLNSGTPGQQGPGEMASAPAGLTLFEALPDQLGLKLEMRKGPQDVIVIDAANRGPLAN